ncbi:MAG: type II secretion system protein GspK [Burkholderiales bacterium]|nr:type II secretion system protein GspK [Burkholderiales bacterium]
MKKHNSQRGFVLILTLLVLVIVALAAGYFSERVSRSVELAERSNQNVSAMIDMASTRAEILYRLSTTSMTEYGLGRGGSLIQLDNRPYSGSGDTLLRVQDDRGLLNLNASEDDRLQRLLGMLGIAADQRPHLIDTLRDYIDSDDLHRLNGAEKAEYLALNLPPPPNRNLATPWEAHAIIGWRTAPQLWQNARLVELTTTGVATGINPNTAPMEILVTLPGFTDDLAQRVIAQRVQLPFTDARQLSALTGIPKASFEDIASFIPSNSVRITQSSQALAWAVLTVELGC